MHRMILIPFLAVAQVLFAGGCSKPSPESMELAHYPIDGLEGILTKSGVIFDTRNSTDGNGSVQIDTWESVTVRLFEVTDIVAGPKSA